MSQDVLLKMVRAEFAEMPGLRVTLAQAQRLWNSDRTTCQQVLDLLVEAEFLSIKPNGMYGRSSDGADAARHSHYVKAHLHSAHKSQMAS